MWQLWNETSFSRLATWHRRRPLLLFFLATRHFGGTPKKKREEKKDPPTPNTLFIWYRNVACRRQAEAGAWGTPHTCPRVHVTYLKSGVEWRARDRRHPTAKKNKKKTRCVCLLLPKGVLYWIKVLMNRNLVELSGKKKSKPHFFQYIRVHTSTCARARWGDTSYA